MYFQARVDLLTLPELLRKHTLLNPSGIIKGQREKTVRLNVLNGQACLGHIWL